MSLKARDVDFPAIWEKLSATMSKVVTSCPVKRSTWNDMFMDIYALCIARPEPLTNELYTSIRHFLEQHVEELYEKIVSSDNILLQYHKYWSEFSRGAEYLDLLFSYLNQRHIKSYKQSAVDYDYEFSFDMKDPMLEVGELALDTWHLDMLDKIGERLVGIILNMIDMDREDESVDRKVVYEVIQSFVIVKQHRRKQALKLYEELFEQKYLERSEKYYRKKAAEFMESQDCSIYMEKVLELLINEDRRSSNFLNSSSHPKVTKAYRQRMVSDYMDFLHLNSRDMVRQNRTTDLGHLFTLLKHIPKGLDKVCEEVQSHVEETGLLMVKKLKEDSNLPSTFVDCVLEIHGRFSQVITECFQENEQFKKSLHNACCTIVNYREEKQPCKSPELVGRYSDGLLRKTSKALSENEIDDKLNNCITVFQFIEDKDLFQRFYSRHLAKRLIQSLSNSIDMEETMINRLKNVCGYDFTSKLHRMYTDIRLSTDLNSKFNGYLTKNQDTVNINFNINVLQAGAWPLSSAIGNFHVPQELTKSLMTFEKFYNEEFNGRKLAWLHHMSQAEVRAQFTGKTYFVTMTTYQLAVMLLFNESVEQLFSVIAKWTGMGDKELEKTISLLVDAKLLIKERVDEKEVKYTLNEGFVNRRTKFKIAAASQKDTIKEVQATHSAVVKDRELYLQAAIVRIMKARKTLRHNELMQEVISLSKARFSPSVAIIKKTIEKLIEKAYLERNPTSPDEYRYLA